MPSGAGEREHAAELPAAEDADARHRRVTPRVGVLEHVRVCSSR